MSADLSVFCCGVFIVRSTWEHKSILHNEQICDAELRNIQAAQCGQYPPDNGVQSFQYHTFHFVVFNCSGSCYQLCTAGFSCRLR